MTKRTLFNVILFGLLLVAFTYVAILQNKVNALERIVEIEQEIAQYNEEIELHKAWYKISMEASEECAQSFIDDARKEHEEADKKRELIKQLEEEKLGLMKNR